MKIPKINFSMQSKRFYFPKIFYGIFAGKINFRNLITIIYQTSVNSIIYNSNFILSHPHNTVPAPPKAPGTAHRPPEAVHGRHEQSVFLRP